MKADKHTPASGLPLAAGPSRLWRTLPLAFVIAGLCAFFLSGAHRYIGPEQLVQSRGELQALTRSHMALSLLVYAGIYVLAVTLSLPGALLLTIAGGFLFGGWIGGTVTVLAATTGATLLFQIARTSLGDILRRRSGPFLDRFRDGFQKDAASYMLFLRLVPIFPFWLVNLAPAILGVKTWTFFWTTLLGVIPGTYAYALAGAGLDSVVQAQKAAFDSCRAAGNSGCALSISPASLVTRELILGFAAIGVAALIPVVLKKWRGTGLPASQPRGRKS